MTNESAADVGPVLAELATTVSVLVGSVRMLHDKVTVLERQVTGQRADPATLFDRRGHLIQLVLLCLWTGATTWLLVTR